MHYGHNIRKYDQILKIDLKIFRVIDNYNISLFNVYHDIMSRINIDIGKGFQMYFVKTNQIISDFGKSRV